MNFKGFQINIVPEGTVIECERTGRKETVEKGNMVIKGQKVSVVQLDYDAIKKHPEVREYNKYKSEI